MIGGIPSGRRAVPVAIFLLFVAVLVSYLVYTSQIAEELRQDAAVFSRIYFQTVQAAASPEGFTPEGEFALLRQLYALGIPVVQTDLEGEPTLMVNLPFEADLENPADRARVRTYVERLDEENPPLVDGEAGFVVHYGEPAFLRRLRWIPWLQAILLLAVVGIGAWIVRTSNLAERERIWSGMARESAHQMGTPLSSLVGWLELLEADDLGASGSIDVGDAAVDIHEEMRHDLLRLEKVSRRFEAIGRTPELRPVDVTELLRNLSRYFEARLPTLGGRIRLETDLPEMSPVVQGNETLLEWAFENLVKNALDSLAGREGTIRISHGGVQNGRAVYRVEDDGEGVPEHLRASLFDVGVTTKQGGWGVGLSLARRIIVEVHGGALRLEESEEGAVFSLELPLIEDSR
ncbi:MAG: HAMP domain-containing histidine kinase [marine benthic group bacterium]|nr:HAMP domain-containing histidine kinase [Gemmatimonadota bacterium]MCL7962813.1 HAMP domain-containing histidine kinase [Candidatus Carthagonibacter metallireducens]MCL7938556.1 HAMP domain-containing histidine kinase [Gemmatimonadota bacterium]MCL7965255.1 HAMP domain-containing histidine kinase [Gemmatimonadota bacterium]MCL7967298.1 HAMP domain-containing histidine kinase [Gemmatimonadota bacterium]